MNVCYPILILIYMKLRNATEGVFLYENKNTQELLVIPVQMTEKNKKTLVSLRFKITNKKSSNIMNMYIGLYFKKIFHRFKQYFE